MDFSEQVELCQRKLLIKNQIIILQKFHLARCCYAKFSISKNFSGSREQEKSAQKATSNTNRAIFFNEQERPIAKAVILSKIDEIISTDELPDLIEFDAGALPFDIFKIFNEIEDSLKHELGDAYCQPPKLSRTQVSSGPPVRVAGADRRAITTTMPAAGAGVGTAIEHTPIKSPSVHTAIVSSVMEPPIAAAVSATPTLFQPVAVRSTIIAESTLASAHAEARQSCCFII